MQQSIRLDSPKVFQKWYQAAGINYIIRLISYQKFDQMSFSDWLVLQNAKYQYENAEKIINTCLAQI